MDQLANCKPVYHPCHYTASIIELYCLCLSNGSCIKKLSKLNVTRFSDKPALYCAFHVSNECCYRRLTVVIVEKKLVNFKAKPSCFTA